MFREKHKVPWLFSCKRCLRVNIVKNIVISGKIVREVKMNVIIKKIITYIYCIWFFIFVLVLVFSRNTIKYFSISNTLYIVLFLYLLIVETNYFDKVSKYKEKKNESIEESIPPNDN